MTKKQGNTIKPVGTRNVCDSDNQVVEKSNVNIVHANASSYNFLIGAFMFIMFFFMIGLASYLVYTNLEYKKDLTERLDKQDLVINSLITAKK